MATKEQTFEMIKVMEGYIDGKEIQCRGVDFRDEQWVDEEPSWDWISSEYRIKPEPKIIYVNEYDNMSGVAHETESSAISAAWNAASGKAVPYVRLSDVKELK